MVLWPLLTFAALGDWFRPRRHVRQGPIRLPRVVNGPAIIRSLVLFNALFALQNGMDLAFLAGGVRLPEGMSFAEYAHRGAYPLVLLALLSGAFAMLARPFVTGAPVLRALLVVWVAQTVWLTCSSGLRLELYVETYGLTRLRLAAGIWMGLVAIGLVLIGVQILRARGNWWLLRRVTLAGVATLYLCCFVSFDRAIATYNLTHDVPRDMAYLCNLGEAAVPVMLREIGRAAPPLCRFHGTGLWVTEPRDWREWGFRNARVRRSLAQSNPQGAVE